MLRIRMGFLCVTWFGFWAGTHPKCLCYRAKVIGNVGVVWLGGVRERWLVSGAEVQGGGGTGSPADPSPLSLLGSAKSRLAFLPQRPSSEPGGPTCTQSCPQPPEPGEGAPHSQDHPNHEVRFPWEHLEAGSLSPYNPDPRPVKEGPRGWGVRGSCCSASPTTPSTLVGGDIYSSPQQTVE